jgi:hypothetical protein
MGGDGRTRGGDRVSPLAEIEQRVLARAKEISAGPGCGR